MQQDQRKSTPPQEWRASVAAARQLTVPPGNLAAPVFGHGSMLVEYYAPKEIDHQQPHTRDELYVIIAGSGDFIHGEQRQPFSAGDLLFVPAGAVHRFVNFTADFATWVIFYGPEGGESDTQTP